VKLFNHLTQLTDHETPVGASWARKHLPKKLESHLAFRQLHRHRRRQPQQQRSHQFIAECQQENACDTAPDALDSYEELLASPNVDVIYVPIPTGVRKEWIIRAAQAGKHILCEKPCGGTVDDTREMIEACQRNRVQFMDGVMFMHNPRLDRIRQALEKRNHLWRYSPHHLAFQLFIRQRFPRRKHPQRRRARTSRCLGDLGWYCIRFALWTMNWKMPQEVSGRIISQTGNEKSKAAVPFDSRANCFFENNISSGFFCSFLTAYSNWATVTGTKRPPARSGFCLPKKEQRGRLEIDGVSSDRFDRQSSTARTQT